MKSGLITSLILGATLATARPVHKRTAFTKREVPQEHSHQPFIDAVNTALNIDNPDGIVDSVFGLLGNAAAQQGLGSLTDPECLQQETADRAFTNAKAAADVDAMTSALVYRALERNTGKVGLQSNSCTTAAVNPEIAAISQHQDPASDGAADTNKQIVIILAQQIASVGGNPNDALKSGTFAPGDTADATGAGNTCDDANDTAGCIFSQNLLVEDASADEIAAAGAGAAANATAAAAAGNATVAAANSTAAANATDIASIAAAANASAADAAAQEQAKKDEAAQMAAAKKQAAEKSQLTAPAGGYNFGSDKCSNPSIAYGNGFDGRSDASFRADTTVVFIQQSNTDVIIVASSICDTLEFQCGAELVAIQQCRKTVVVIQEKGWSDGFAAVVFNQALGVEAVIVGVDLNAGKKNDGKKNKDKNDGKNKDKNNNDNKNDKNNKNNKNNNDNVVVVVGRDEPAATIDAPVAAPVRMMWT